MSSTDRRGHTNEHLFLLKKIQELDSVLAPLLERVRAQEVRAKKRRYMLPWKEIAGVLKEERHLATSQWKALKTQVTEYESLALEMRKWVIANCAIETPLNSRTSTWRECSLLANPRSRQLGKEWILKQMYHNADRVFMEHGFPAIDSPNELDGEFSMEFTDAGFHTVYRGQVEQNKSLEAAVAHTFATMHTLRLVIPGYSDSMPMLLNETEGTTRHYVFAVPPPVNEFVNVLAGEFRTEKRCLVVVQQIQDDEMYDAGTYRQRNRTLWVDIHALSSGRSKIRVAAFCSHGSTKAAGMVPMEEDARVYGIDLSGCPDHLKKTRMALSFSRLVGQALQAKGVRV
ncbi:Aste57867_8636 [Aphanomyces stellatus]|uniref:Aste57867_8636 protein n=1 Tax=Aphanomyces stellatus TaxID=120398 RepID=A0A485KL52_9STRA|nr:hypothetical protein As57867_008602 [Aphanomyces stellatus]VFT85522.1 Aste57867_8636 [Aphanomyces stellatus]